jgi:hypothetical protein
MAQPDEALYKPWGPFRQTINALPNVYAGYIYGSWSTFANWLYDRDEPVPE